ncbi:RdgB/HAM1 family non-canonical purine NTP pyrophosphatase [Candidatus Uhrbacteria bacterium]|nr:RdgB/HAM1 family non-canonical purine NTP pyrophosphatase [Candidatus Uhrbacteria bacterium]
MNNTHIVLATKNNGKLKEIRVLLAQSGIDVLCAEEVGVAEEITEDGKTLQENALKKASFVFERVHGWTAGEDTGLFIDALDGEPGIHTARWLGEGGDHVAYTLERMKGIPPVRRAAHFTAIVALISPEGKEFFFEGRVDGHILEAARGTAHPHLPYDVLFVPDEGDGRTFAEMTGEEKNMFSHRARAIQKMKDFLS